MLILNLSTVFIMVFAAFVLGAATAFIVGKRLKRK